MALSAVQFAQASAALAQTGLGAGGGQGPSGWLLGVLMVAGGALIGLGLWPLAISRGLHGAQTTLPLLGRVSRATLFIAGLSFMAMGYHLIAWSLPSGWLRLRIPTDRWWLLAAAPGIALPLSMLMDAADRRLLAEAGEDGGEAGPGQGGVGEIGGRGGGEGGKP